MEHVRDRAASATPRRTKKHCVHPCSELRIGQWTEVDTRKKLINRKLVTASIRHTNAMQKTNGKFLVLMFLLRSSNTPSLKAKKNMFEERKRKGHLAFFRIRVSLNTAGTRCFN